jgi:hypothetical protein
VVDFSALGSSSSSSNEDDPRKIFNSLVKPEGVNELYASQGEVLEKWHSSRGNRDHIVKLPTGGGKSLVGLLIAQSSLNELKLPALYAVPTRQLVKQVCEEAARFGIAAEPYISAKYGIPNSVLDGNAICVLTYDAIFNGKSKFGTTTKVAEIDAPGILVLDDAHAAFESVWDSFTFTVSKADHLDLYNDLAGRFRKSFEDIGRHLTFDDVVMGKDYYVMEVPYWDWLEKQAEVGTVLQTYDPDKVDAFAWQHVRDELQSCHALVSKNAFSIVPLLPFVDKALAFSSAKRRLYMSATISNDSELVRTFGASAKAVSDPIVAASLAGVGERMILAPALTQLPTGVTDKTLIESLIGEAKAKDKNALILTRSFDAAKSWSGASQVAAKTEESEALIDKLRAQRGVAVTVPRRYDGVDLPGEDCRILVLDELPYGSSDYDSWRMSTLWSGIASSQLAQRIEQAIGRASRGTSDYCVVILTGRELVNWIGRSSNQSFLSSSTKKQLQIGLTVSEAVTTSEEFKATAWQCLNRDAGWRAYHAKEMAAAAIPEPPDQSVLELWEAERAGVAELRIRKFSNAVNEFDAAIDIATDPATKGWFHQLKARAIFQAGDEAQSEEWQSKAYRLNMRLTPPRGQIRVVRMDPPGQQAMMVCSKLGQYVHPGVAISAYDDVASLLTPWNSSNQFEEALDKLFTWLGFSASRPDYLYKQGPDNLILAEDGFALIIEAKSRRKGKNKFTKTMHGQVLNHENWFNANYSPSQARQRVVIAATGESEDNAGTNGTLVLTFDTLASIVQDGRKMLQSAANVPKDQCFAAVDQAIKDLKLTHADLVARLSPFSDAN